MVGVSLNMAAERTWAEIAGAMSAPRPGRFVEVLRDCGALGALLPEVDVLFGIPQPAEYHPEIDTGAHVLMTMNEAAAARCGPRVVFALMLHDLGKGLTPRAEWPQHLGHEEKGAPLVEAEEKVIDVRGEKSLALNKAR